MSALLSEVARLVGSWRVLGPDLVVHGVKRDSREVEKGDLFVALAGDRSHGRQHVADAIERGAVAIASETPIDAGVSNVVVDDAGHALGLAAELVYGQPLAALSTLGVTGTNGKTTCVHLLGEVLSSAGLACASVGTGYMRAPGIERSSRFTTPYGDELARFATEAVAAGATHLLMEVSSHGLALDRVNAVRFEVAAFTNLSQDHLDFHPTMAAYGEAKARLFTDYEPKVSVINIDDPFGGKLVETAHGRVIRVSASGKEDAEIRALVHRESREGMKVDLEIMGRPCRLESTLIGTYNLENLLVVLGCTLALGIAEATAIEAIKAAKGAPGRLEKVAHPGDVTILVDYAHTPDALRRVLAALRPLTPGRLFVAFGCGGDRDREKRPQMGSAAAELADVCVLTSDNPRTESPGAILDAVVRGVRSVSQDELEIDSLPSAQRGYVVIEDRADAIRAVVTSARAGDTVLIAGKGHEDYQVVGTERRPFDDRVHARAAVDALEATWRP